MSKPSSLENYSQAQIDAAGDMLDQHLEMLSPVIAGIVMQTGNVVATVAAMAEMMTRLFEMIIRQTLTPEEGRARIGELLDRMKSFADESCLQIVEERALAQDQGQLSNRMN